MSSPIPVKNIYYLLSYAWDRLPESEVTDVSGLESTELVDLFATVLSGGINHLLRRGLDQGYLLHDEEIAGVRGRINVARTARRMLLAHGRAHCEFDELSIDTQPNRILRATVRRLLKAKNVDKELRLKLRGLDRELRDVTEVPLTKHLFRSVQLHGNNRYYRFLLNICEMALDMSLVDEEEGAYRFRDFIRDERAMARLFESFLFNFYRIERPDLRLKKERIYWQASSSSDPELRFLPTMETDISVRNKPHTETLIIDAKFYEQTFQKHYDKESVHSANLYQLASYLRNLEYREGPDSQAAGMLIYPVVERSVRLSYELNGHPMQIATVNLNAEWQDIRAELLELIE
ncbi:MAG: 5-methylcytosine-specific restriction endonuclease system specificity protein McrC [Gammaproteobacteria bacterium]|nr:5-methylcytosine-specific restriction endonuclease system specificity protein McrC [Gammaproteobacteria bacterium]